MQKISEAIDSIEGRGAWAEGEKILTYSYFAVYC